MKKSIMMPILAITLVQAYAQKVNKEAVPVVVKTAFAKAYPSVTSVKWEKEASDYEAGFKQGKKEMSVVIDDRGMIKEEETAIAKNELPKAVQLTLAKDYAGYKVEEAAKIISDKVVTYEAEVENGEETFELIFDANGKLIKKAFTEKEKEDEKD